MRLLVAGILLCLSLTLFLPFRAAGEAGVISGVVVDFTSGLLLVRWSRFARRCELSGPRQPPLLGSSDSRRSRMEPTSLTSARTVSPSTGGERHGGCQRCSADAAGSPVRCRCPLRPTRGLLSLIC